MGRISKKQLTLFWLFLREPRSWGEKNILEKAEAFCPLSSPLFCHQLLDHYFLFDVVIDIKKNNTNGTRNDHQQWRVASSCPSSCWQRLPMEHNFNVIFVQQMRSARHRRKCFLPNAKWRRIVMDIKWTPAPYPRQQPRATQRQRCASATARRVLKVSSALISMCLTPWTTAPPRRKTRELDQHWKKMVSTSVTVCGATPV